MDKSELGSKTAIGGFRNEKDICLKFINWKNDPDSQSWLKTIGYNLTKLEYVDAIPIPARIRKTDLAKTNMNK